MERRVQPLVVTKRPRHITDLPSVLLQHILSFCDGTTIYRFLYMVVYDGWPSDWAHITISHLDLSDSKVTNKALHYFTHSFLPVRYSKISLVNCKAIHHHGLRYLCTDVREINLSGATSINDKSLQTLSSFMKLSRLNLASQMPE
eukprot:TRINITY_DN1078_c0_g1_i1.p1 TRINITY_DN1078_c0_g1~~TRINITY_DN1078_c0_g1_i1.p1  ORF type:complete len:145 (+),score=13.94 TRINITY_DN1078_c0_g1_i1:193-627(+)